MDRIFLDQTEKAQHEEAIHRLCQEHPDKVEFVRRSYLEILERVAADATIHTFLTILITREVKALIRIEELSKPE